MEAGAAGLPGPPACEENILERVNVIIPNRALEASNAKVKVSKQASVLKNYSRTSLKMG